MYVGQLHSITVRLCQYRGMLGCSQTTSSLYDGAGLWLSQAGGRASMLRITDGCALHLTMTAPLLAVHVQAAPQQQQQQGAQADNAPRQPSGTAAEQYHLPKHAEASWQPHSDFARAALAEAHQPSLQEQAVELLNPQDADAAATAVGEAAAKQQSGSYSKRPPLAAIGHGKDTAQSAAQELQYENAPSSSPFAGGLEQHLEEAAVPPEAAAETSYQPVSSGVDDEDSELLSNSASHCDALPPVPHMEDLGHVDERHVTLTARSAAHHAADEAAASAQHSAPLPEDMFTGLSMSNVRQDNHGAQAEQDLLR